MMVVASPLKRRHSSLSGREDARASFVVSSTAQTFSHTSAGAAVVAFRQMSPVGKALGARELGVFAELAHLALAGTLVLLVAHLDIVLRVASQSVLVEEGRIPALEDVDVGVVERGVAVHVQLSVAFAEVESPKKY